MWSDLAPSAHLLSGSQLCRETNNSFGATLNEKRLSRPLKRPLRLQHRICFAPPVYFVFGFGQTHTFLASFRARKAVL